MALEVSIVVSLRAKLCVFIPKDGAELDQGGVGIASPCNFAGLWKHGFGRETS